MNSIMEYFEHEVKRETDINQHLECLRGYASKCEHITELGVRDVVSTWAFLAGNPKRLLSIDIQQATPNKISDAYRFCQEVGINFEFRIADTSDENLVLEETDLLFIDTWHIYDQLKRELELHAGKSRKYIIMHDTTLFEFEGTNEHFNAKIASNATRKGLWPAIEEFLEVNPQWSIKERFTHNCGLTILAKDSN